MPNRDGTGPFGQGPKTGRGLGPCGGGQARGNGRGKGLGQGRFQEEKTDLMPKLCQTLLTKFLNLHNQMF